MKRKNSEVQDVRGLVLQKATLFTSSDIGDPNKGLANRYVILCGTDKQGKYSYVRNQLSTRSGINQVNKKLDTRDMRTVAGSS